ncbi:hypothetical protein MTO96_010698 [Rhipicephalus appendiculatus]
MMRSLERMSERVSAGTIRLGTKLARLSEALAARLGTSAQWVPSELARKDSPDESLASMRLDSGSKPNRWFTKRIQDCRPRKRAKLNQSLRIGSHI